ncbi:hypothetical protein V473_04925 [Sphingobium cupriresistens LL01]|uniref:Uncharacterized protein n=1 Tax=Sphingobium cupriresistens LL01 TaxID=1420583 RepID=A0A0J7Y4E2_9SPHN|nr:hypothetical protein V473_04925 [Sphingobium cupriresistens LL01]
MPDALFRFVTHPLPVIANIFGKALRALALPMSTLGNLCPRLRVDRWLPCKLRRDFDKCFADQHRDRIEVRSIGTQTQPLRLQWDRSAA